MGGARRWIGGAGVGEGGPAARQLGLTARRHRDQVRAGRDPERDRIAGRGVARVQRHHRVDGVERGERGERGERFPLPPGSRVLDTGGYKRQSRELPLDAFYDAVSNTFDVPRERCINMYGMTELSTQFYDDGNATLPSVKSGLHWIRSRAIDPMTGRDVPFGERGVLVHCDVANFNSTTTILTEDVGRMVDGGFELLGRVEGAAAKGCSLAVEAFLDAARGFDPRVAMHPADERIAADRDSGR